MDTKTISSIADEAAQILVATVPALGPYGVPIDLAFTLAATVAPPLYSEIKSLIAGIQSGNPPTDADIAALRDLINNLKNPDNYFGGPAPTAAVTVAELPAAAAPGIVTAPTRNGQPL